jgi:OOP family OmpA-OmpF porin
MDTSRLRDYPQVVVTCRSGRMANILETPMDRLASDRFSGDPVPDERDQNQELPRMRYRTAMLATALAVLPLATLIAVPTQADAQPISGLYIGAGAGLHAPQDPKATPFTSSFGTGQVELNEDFGFNSNLALGYALGNGARFEIEGNFMRSELRQLTGTPFPTTSDGHVRTVGAMANALFDMDIGNRYIFPYLGVGAGYQWTALSSVSTTQYGGPFQFATNSQAGTFAMQAILGTSFPIPNMPGLSLTVDYRFMDILGGPKFDGTEVVTAGGPAMSSGLKLHNQFNNDVVIGVRYAFNVAPPPLPPTPAPAAAPAPEPARSYMVFFDWDKASLTDRARAIIKVAADNSTHVQFTRIEVNGYTDTSGSPKYNQGLSVRRAKAVAGELVHDGVPQNAIDIHGFGDTHLLVPTGPGVREAQNRRVEIIIR